MSIQVCSIETFCPVQKHAPYSREKIVRVLLKGQNKKLLKIIIYVTHFTKPIHPELNNKNLHIHFTHLLEKHNKKTYYCRATKMAYAISVLQQMSELAIHLKWQDQKWLFLVFSPLDQREGWKFEFSST